MGRNRTKPFSPESVTGVFCTGALRLAVIRPPAETCLRNYIFLGGRKKKKNRGRFVFCDFSLLSAALAPPPLGYLPDSSDRVINTDTEIRANILVYCTAYTSAVSVPYWERESERGAFIFVFMRNMKKKKPVFFFRFSTPVYSTRRYLYIFIFMLLITWKPFFFLFLFFFKSKKTPPYLIIANGYFLGRCNYKWFREIYPISVVFIFRLAIMVTRTYACIADAISYCAHAYSACL